MMHKAKNRFDLSNNNALITGGGGLLGPQHGIALAKWGAAVVLVDIDETGLNNAKNLITKNIPGSVIKTAVVDITKESALLDLCNQLKDKNLAIDILINNASINPTMDPGGSHGYTVSLDEETSGSVEDYDMDLWYRELDVGITGTFLCCKVFGSVMASHGAGVIINIASDLAIQAPDQRLYSHTGEMDDVKHFKPLGYSVVKSAMLGLNKYLATYWAHKGVRVNCLLPGAVLNTQSHDLVKKVSNKIPIGRLAHKYEYQEAIAFLASSASSYMTGQELIIDGGRSIW